jgi:hypothetical protein
MYLSRLHGERKLCFIVLNFVAGATKRKWKRKRSAPGDETSSVRAMGIIYGGKCITAILDCGGLSRGNLDVVIYCRKANLWSFECEDTKTAPLLV